MRFHFCEDNQMASTDTTSALTSIINILTPLTSEDRHRTVNAAMLFLGETVKAPGPAGTGKGVGEGSNPGAVGAWMTQYGVSQDQMDQVFHFNNDGSFSIHDAPGRSKKEKTLNTYILTGLWEVPDDKRQGIRRLYGSRLLRDDRMRRPGEPCCIPKEQGTRVQR